MHFDYSQYKQKGSPRFAGEAGFAPIIFIFLIIAIVGVTAAIFLNKGRVVTVEDSKLESLMPTPVKITEQQAVEKVKNLSEVQEYLKNNPNGIVEFGGRATVGDFPSADQENLVIGESRPQDYLVRVYMKFPDHQQTFNWYIVSEKTGRLFNIGDPNYTDDEKRKLDTYNYLYYSLPKGWKIEVGLGYWMRTYEVVTFERGDYSINLGTLGSGRADCKGSKSLNDFIVLKNKNLGGKTVLRDKFPEKTSDLNHTKINVCSDFVETNKFDYGTKLGSITYSLPVNPDPKILQDMDSIVESLTPRSDNSQKGTKIDEPFIDIPSNWNTYLDFAQLNGLSRHLITSYQFETFDFPKKGEYAFMIGVEDKNILSDLETYLKSKPDISENETLNKAKNGVIYIRRDVGSEYFKKVGNTILVIFVYDNGDQIIDSTEQKVIDSLGI